MMGGGMGGGMRARPQMPEDWTARFETFNGQSVTGKIQLSSVDIACSLGLYEIKPGKIKSIQFNPAPETVAPSQNGAFRDGTVLTDSGESVAGKINVPNWWKVETDLGTLTPDAQQLKAITFLGRSETRKPGEQPGRPSNLPDKPSDQPGKPQSGDQQSKRGEGEKKS
jgi:hypothetical protein